MKGKVAKAVLCASLGNILWGFSFLFTRVGLDVAPNPNVMLSHRFMLSALFMAFSILIGKAKVSLKGKNWKPLAILLVTQIGYYVFETYGLLYTNATIAGMVLAVVSGYLFAGTPLKRNWTSWLQLSKKRFCLEQDNKYQKGAALSGQHLFKLYYL